MAVGSFATALDMDRTTLTRNLKPLIDAGLVALSRSAAMPRSADRADRRGPVARLRAARAVVASAQDEIGRTLGAARVGHAAPALRRRRRDLERSARGAVGDRAAAPRRRKPTTTAPVPTAAPAGEAPSRSNWPLLLAAAAILMVTMGARQSIGLFLSPINTVDRARHRVHQLRAGHRAVHVGRGAADLRRRRRQIRRVACDRGRRVPARRRHCDHAVHAPQAGLIVAMGMLTAAGAGAGSFSILIGATAQRLPAERRVVCGRLHQRRRLVRPVRVRAGDAGASSARAAGWRDAVDGRDRARRRSRWRGRCAARATAAERRRRRVRRRRGRRRHRAEAQLRDGDARPELPVPARRLFHLRLPYRVPCHAPAGRGALCGLPPQVAAGRWRSSVSSTSSAALRWAGSYSAIA